MDLMTRVDPSAANRREPPHLIRGLGLRSAAAIVIGDMIGTGVFLVTSDMARAVGSISLVFAAWIIGGLITPNWVQPFPKPAATTST